MIHNESVNIWSHLLGVMLFFVFLWHAIAFIDMAVVPEVDCLTELN
jgi:predicted membrane channel-forming protein YqfA (hemolysin III family)